MTISMLSEMQHTLAKPTSMEGIGLHTGVDVHLRIAPAPADTGVVFKRVDLDGFLLEATSRYVARVSYATSLMKKGVLISTIEHLLSALAAEGVDNVLVEIDSLELPILDGSALPFVRLIREAGKRPQRARRSFAKVVKTVEVTEGAKRIAVYPSDRFQLTYHIAFPHPVIGDQTFEFDPARDNYESQIAPARTFGFIEEVEMLRKNGLVRGGSLNNAIVLTRDGILNPEGLRFPDEFCRHKILDLIGDLSLMGKPLIGHVVAERAGHAMHTALVAQLLRRKDAWISVHSPAETNRTPETTKPQVRLTPLGAAG